MKRKQEVLESGTVAVIRSGRKEERLETWRYWEIVGALQWLGADRVTAYDTAKWIQKARPGDTKTIQTDITITITEKET